ncbi:MAG: ATP-dependent zinc metalloprotease FtsH, partial [Actinomycetota bacterium]
AGASAECRGKEQSLMVAYPRSDVVTSQLLDRLVVSGPVKVDKQVNKAIAKLVVGFVFPLLMLANLFGIIFMSKSAESTIGEIIGFGRIGKKRHQSHPAGTGVTFDDVGGAQEAVGELLEVVDYLKNPRKYKEYGAAPPKGVLLFGPPGCGKTLMAKAVAGSAGVPFFPISGAEFIESLVGVGAARVRDLFRQLKEQAPAILFIDEIDAVGRKREGEGITGGEREQTVNQLLIEMDGFETAQGIVVVAATNRPDILDPALLRPGRFDRHVTVEPPDIHGREEIMKLHARGKPIGGDVDFASVAKRTSGFTGADVANVVNESALLALRDGQQANIAMSHVMEAVERVLHGPQRRGRIMSPDERRRLAFHESGHTVVAAVLGNPGDSVRVSILPRGKGLGRSLVAGDSERVLLTSAQMRDQLAIAMAGIAAEQKWFGDSSTTSEDDIDRATHLARQMVGLYGMSRSVGRIRLLSKYDGYLGSDTQGLEVSSGETLQTFDRQVKDLTEAAEQAADAVLSDHRIVVEELAEALNKFEVLEGNGLKSVLAKVVSGRHEQGRPKEV